MIHVTDSIHLDITWDGYKSEPGMFNFRKLLLTSDVTGFLPLFQLDFADTTGQFKNLVNIKDGMPITINIGQTLDAQKEYKFRLFQNKEITAGQFRTYRMTGYLDVPAYLTASSTKHFKDTTSNVIKQILDLSGFEEPELETTTDTQVWYQANKRNMMFVQYLAERGYVDDSSLMVKGVRFNKKFLYKDLNKITGDGVVLAYNPAEGEAQIVDHHVIDNQGGANVQRGYGDQTFAQDMTTDTPIEYKDVKVDPRAQKVGVNEEIKGLTERGRVDITPPHFKDQAHDNYFKAKHQNERGGFLNSTMIDVLCPMQLDALDLLMSCTLRLGNSEDEADSADTVRDGQYVVIRKHIIVEGIIYGERYRLVRAGSNERA